MTQNSASQNAPMMSACAGMRFPPTGTNPTAGEASFRNGYQMPDSWVSHVVFYPVLWHALSPVCSSVPCFQRIVSAPGRGAYIATAFSFRSGPPFRVRFLEIENHKMRALERVRDVCVIGGHDTPPCPSKNHRKIMQNHTGVSRIRSAMKQGENPRNRTREGPCALRSPPALVATVSEVYRALTPSSAP